MVRQIIVPASQMRTRSHKHIKGAPQDDSCPSVKPQCKLPVCLKPKSTWSRWGNGIFVWDLELSCYGHWDCVMARRKALAAVGATPAGILMCKA